MRRISKEVLGVLEKIAHIKEYPLQKFQASYSHQPKRQSLHNTSTVTPVGDMKQIGRDTLEALRMRYPFEAEIWDTWIARGVACVKD